MLLSLTSLATYTVVFELTTKVTIWDKGQVLHTISQNILGLKISKKVLLQKNWVILDLN